MSILSKLAGAQGLKDESANILLAEEIVAQQNEAAVAELMAHLQDKKVQNDCIKTLYEIAGRQPEMVKPYFNDFLKALKSKNNRIQWGAMTALYELSKVAPSEILLHLEELEQAAQSGSVITRDNFVKSLAQLMRHTPYQEQAWSKLSKQLQEAPDNQFAMYAEETAATLPQEYAATFTALLEKRIVDLPKESQQKRIQKILKKLAKG